MLVHRVAALALFLGLASGPFLVAADEPKGSAAAERFGAHLIPAESAGFISIRADDLLTLPWTQTIVKKLFRQTAALDVILDNQYFIGKAANLERVLVVLVPLELLPGKDGPDAVFILSTSKPIDRDRFSAAVKEQKLEEARIKDHSIFSPADGKSQAYCALDDKTLAVGPAAALRRYMILLARKKPPGSLYESFSFKDVDGKSQVLAVLPPTRLMPFPLAKDLQPFEPLYQADWIGIEASAGDAINFVITVKCAKDDAKDAQKAAEGALVTVSGFLDAWTQDPVFREDPDRANLFKVVKEFTTDIKKVKIQNDGDMLKLRLQLKGSGDVLPLGLVEVGEMVYRAANVAKSKSNLWRVGIAINDYEAQRGQLPPPAIYSKDGKPLLSWRVAILPYLDESDGSNDLQKLYAQFNVNEPWDSEHNKKLLEKMPAIYASPGLELKDKSLTYYKAFVGEKALFNKDGKLTLGRIPAGASRTIMAIEAGDPVPWTKPEDFSFDPQKPLPKLVGPYKRALIVLFADGHVRSIPSDFNEKKMRAAIDTSKGCEGDDLEDADDSQGSGSRTQEKRGS